MTIKKEEHLRLVLEEKVGIGQLFFHLRLLPSFVLLQVQHFSWCVLFLIMPVFIITITITSRSVD